MKKNAFKKKVLITRHPRAICFHNNRENFESKRFIIMTINCKEAGGQFFSNLHKMYLLWARDLEKCGLMFHLLFFEQQHY